MNELMWRRSLLISESELNRVQLRAGVAGLAGELSKVFDRSAGLSAIAISGASVVQDLLPTAAGPSTVSWIRSAIDGIELAASIYEAFRSRKSA